MTKCDFCKYSSPDGKCYWSIPALRFSYCEEAIQRMMEALKADKKKTKDIVDFGKPMIVG